MTARRLVDQSESGLRTEVACNTSVLDLSPLCTTVNEHRCHRLAQVPQVAGNTVAATCGTQRKPLEFKWPLELTGHWLSARIVSQPSQVVCSLPPALPLEEGGINKLYL